MMFFLVLLLNGEDYLGCYLICLYKMTVGDRVLMEPGVIFCTSGNIWNSEVLSCFRPVEKLAQVSIKDNAWIDADSIILLAWLLGRVARSLLGPCSLAARLTTLSSPECRKFKSAPSQLGGQVIA